MFVDEKIIFNLDFVKNKCKLANLLLSYFKKNDFEDKNLKKLKNLSKVELLNEDEIIENNVDNFNLIKLTFVRSDNSEYSQIWKCGRFLQSYFKEVIGKILDEDDLFLITQIVLGIHTFEIFLKINNAIVKIDKNISYYYKLNNYKHISGSLGKSCMNDNNSASFYDTINDSVSIAAIVDNNGKVYGRSLLWNTNKGYYLDRIYIFDELFSIGFYMYLYKNFKVNYSFTDIKIFKLGDVSLSVLIDIDSMSNKLLLLSKKEGFNFIPILPYFDTFLGCCKERNKIFLVNEFYYCDDDCDFEKILLNIYLFNILNIDPIIKKETKKEIIDNDLNIHLNYNLIRCFNVHSMKFVSNYNKKEILDGYLIELKNLYKNSNYDYMYIYFCISKSGENFIVDLLEKINVITKKSGYLILSIYYYVTRGEYNRYINIYPVTNESYTERNYYIDINANDLIHILNDFYDRKNLSIYKVLTNTNIVYYNMYNMKFYFIFSNNYNIKDFKIYDELIEGVKKEVYFLEEKEYNDLYLVNFNKVAKNIGHYINDIKNIVDLSYKLMK